MAGAEQRLIEAMLAQREQWFDVAPGKRIRLRRPPQAQMHRLREALGARDWATYATGWEGFTEADFLPPGVGASTPVPFAAELWATLLEDNVAWLPTITSGIVGMVTAHLQEQEQTAKN